MAHHETWHPEQEVSRKSLRAYIIGFIACLLFTLLAFGIVQMQWLDVSHRYIAIAALAIGQLFIQSACFLGLNTSKEGLWESFPFLFVLVVISILVGGSLWIMYNLNYNMITV